MKDGARLLADKYFAEFSDASKLSKEVIVKITLPKEVKSYSVSEKYSNKNVPKFFLHSNLQKVQYHQYPLKCEVNHDKWNLYGISKSLWNLYGILESL